MAMWLPPGCERGGELTEGTLLLSGRKGWPACDTPKLLKPGEDGLGAFEMFPSGKLCWRAFGFNKGEITQDWISFKKKIKPFEWQGVFYHCSNMQLPHS